MNLPPALVVSGIVIVAQFALAIVGLALVEPGVEVPIHILGATVMILIVAFAYSYLVWRHDPDKRTTGVREA